MRAVMLRLVGLFWPEAREMMEMRNRLERPFGAVEFWEGWSA